MKKQTKLLAVLLALMMVLLLTAFGGGRQTRSTVTEKDLTGAWYEEYTGRIFFELKDSGRSESYYSGPRCPGDWTLTDDQLTIDSVTGEDAFFVDSPEKGCLVLTDLRGDTITLWSSEDLAFEAKPVDTLGESREITGDWICEFDFAEAVNRAIAAESEELAEYIYFEKLDIPLVMSFSESGDVRLACYEEGMEDAAEAFGEQYLTFLDRVMTAILSGELAPANDPTGLMEYFGALGYTEEELWDEYEEMKQELLSDDDWALSLLEDITGSDLLNGSYIYRNGTLYLGDHIDGVDLDRPVSVSFSGRKMSLKCAWDIDEADVEDLAMAELFDRLVFVRDAD